MKLAKRKKITPSIFEELYSCETGKIFICYDSGIVKYQKYNIPNPELVKELQAELDFIDEALKICEDYEVYDYKIKAIQLSKKIKFFSEDGLIRGKERTKIQSEMDLDRFVSIIKNANKPDSITSILYQLGLRFEEKGNNLSANISDKKLDEMDRREATSHNGVILPRQRNNGIIEE